LNCVTLRASIHTKFHKIIEDDSTRDITEKRCKYICILTEPDKNIMYMHNIHTVGPNVHSVKQKSSGLKFRRGTLKIPGRLIFVSQSVHEVSPNDYFWANAVSVHFTSLFFSSPLKEVEGAGVAKILTP
jgi:hypothetical protein